MGEMEAGKIEMGEDKIGLVVVKTTELTMEDRENSNNKRQHKEVEVVEETIGQEDRQARVQAMSYRCVLTYVLASMPGYLELVWLVVQKGALTKSDLTNKSY